MSSNLLGSFIHTVTGLLSAHGPATQAAAGSYTQARASGELETIEGALAAEAAA